MSVLEKYLEKPVVAEPRPDPEAELALALKPPRSAGRTAARVVVTFVVLAALGLGGLMGWAAIFNPAMDVSGYENGTKAVTFTSVHGGYTASFPAQPKLTVESGRVDVEGNVMATIAGVERRNGVVAVTYLDLSGGLQWEDDDVDGLLRAVTRGTVKEVGFKLVSERFTTFLGRRALHFKATHEDQVSEGEVFLAGERIYVVEAGAVGSPHPKMFTRLKNSFRLNKTAA